MKMKSLFYLLSFIFLVFMISCKTATTDKATDEAVEEEAVVEEVWVDLFDGETTTG